MIIYTDRFIPSGSRGCARGPVILIRPQYRDDRGLLEHEKVHARQWWRSLGLYSFLYSWSKSYRYKAEVKAYREQARWYPDDRRPKFANFIATKYDLDISEAEALAALIK